MTQYDPKVIYRYATSLYSRAQMLVLVYTLVGVLVGGGLGKAYGAYKDFTSAPPSWPNFLGSALGVPTPPTARSSSSSSTLLGILAFGLLGFWIGSNKAFVLKLQAQTALCQVKIEENTKPAGA
jgi:hypothetical protein